MVSQSTEVQRADNISTVLLLPCITIKDNLTRQFSEFGFVNTYLYCEKYYYDFNVIYLVFKPSEFTLGFYNFVTDMEKSVNFVETIDEPWTVILVFRVPPRFGTDYLLFLNGAYSLTSPDFKACFRLTNYVLGPDGKTLRTSTGSLQTEYTIYYHIFNKTEYLRNQWIKTLGEDIVMPKNMELYQKCDINKETLAL